MKTDPYKTPDSCRPPCFPRSYGPVAHVVRAWLRFTNLFRTIKRGYVVEKGTVEVVDGTAVIKGWVIDCLGAACAFSFTGPTIRIGGRDTGIAVPVPLKGEIRNCGAEDCFIKVESELETLERKAAFWNACMVVGPQLIILMILVPTTFLIYLWLVGFLLLSNIAVAARYAFISRALRKVREENEDRRRRETFLQQSTGPNP